MADNYTVQIDLEIIDAEETEMILEKFTGIDGNDGKSAYQYAVEHGYTGTEEEFAEYMANAAEYSEHIQETVDDAIQDALDSGDFVPDMEIGTVQTVPHGQSASANITGTKRNPVLNLNIPQGASGNETIDDTAGFGDDDLVWSADKTLKEVDSKADAICKTIDTPASIITIEDGADDLPVKEMKIAIEPVQDLHGYDYPWCGGSVPNLIPDTTDSSNGYVANKYLKSDGTIGDATANYISEYFVVQPNTIYTLSQLNDSANAASICFYDSQKNYLSGVALQKMLSQQVVTPADAAYARCTQQKDLTTDIIQFELGDTATETKPYSNICPIEGWTRANVTTAGKNLFPNNAFQQGGIDTSGNDSDAAGTYGQRVRTVGFIKLEAGTYTISSAGTKRIYLRIYDLEGHIINALTNQLMPMTFTLDEDRKIRFALANSDATTNIQPSDVSELQIENGTSATIYEPYHGETYFITFPSEAGTVYGGELTINADGTGELVVDHGSVDLGSLTWEASSDNVSFISTTAVRGIKVPASQVAAANAICSNYKAYKSTDMLNGTFGIAPSGKIKVRDDAFSLNTTNFKTAMNGVLLVYKLASSDEHTLTAPQVRTLLGLNQIYADAGDIESITYPVDTATEIDNQTTTTQGMIAGSDSPVATESHAFGDVFICDNKLYKATDAIAVGESIIEGSNVEQTTVADELNAIWGSIATGVSF